MSDIFISYSRLDRGRAETLAQALEQQGWSVWWDYQILPGETFSRVIEVAIENAKCVIVLWSKKSVSSEWVQNEASEGARREILIPVLIEDVIMPLGFRGKHAARLTDWQGESSHPEFRQLLKAVARILGHTESKETEHTDDEKPKKAHSVETSKFLTDFLDARKSAQEIVLVKKPGRREMAEEQRAEELKADSATKPLHTPVEDYEILDILKEHLWPGRIEFAPINLERFRGSPLLSAIPKNESILAVFREKDEPLIFTERGIYFKGEGGFPIVDVARIAYEHFPNRKFMVTFGGVELGAQGVFPTTKRVLVRKLLAALEEIKKLVIIKSIVL